MKQTDPNHTPLRQEAEAQLAHEPKKTDTRTAEELLHELEVHQIELEMQNEHLRQSQVELEESLARYVDFYDFAPVGYLTINHEGMIEEINFTGAALLGVVRSKLIHHRFDFFVAMEDRERWHRHLINVLTCDDKLTCEVAFQHDADPCFDAQLDCQRLKRADKKPVVRVVLTNISKRKQADEALRRSETKFRTLYDSTSDAVMLLDNKGFLDCNKATLVIFGCATKKEFCSKHPADLSPPEQPCGTSSLALADQHIATAMEKGNYQFEWVHQRADTGKSFFADVLLNSMVLDGKPVLQATVRDITGRKQIEEKLRGSENRNRLLVENSPVCIHEIGMDGRITSMNPAGLRMMGTEDECAVRGFLYLDAVCDADRERIGELLARAYAGETSHFEFKASGPQGLIFKSCFVPIKNREGGVEKLMGITEDITERRQAEEKLQRFFDLVPELTCIASTDGYFLKINPAWQATLGYTEQELLSTPFLDFIHPDDRDATMKEVGRQLAGEATKRFTNRYRHKDGGYRWLEWTAKSDVDKKLIYASARDITARQQAGE